MKRSLSWLLGLSLLIGCGAGDPAEPGDAARTAVAASELGDLAEQAGGVRVLDPDSTPGGRSITSWTKAWWRWTFAVPAAQNPELVLDARCGVGQDAPVFFVPEYDGSGTFVRNCRVPEGKPVLVPLWVIINDYPCPDPSFQPAPGQSLQDFLTQGAVAFNDLTSALTVTVDGQPVDPAVHRHTTDLFNFTADPSLVGVLPDACLQGTLQPGVSDGWWLMLALGGGYHTVHVQAVDPTGAPFDATYRLFVEH